MNNKVLIGVVVVLAAALIFESAYLLGSRQQQNAYKDNLALNQRVVAPQRNHPTHEFFDDMQGWDPFVEMERMQQRMHSIFDDSFSKGLVDKNVFRNPAYFEPNISINQKDDSYIVRVDLPGLEKNSINIQVKGQDLIISGERKEEETNQNKGLYRQELSYGSFARTIRLPEDAKTNEITSEYANGVLTITIPKNIAKQATPPIKVPVK